MMLSIWLAVRLFVCCCCLKLSRQQWCYISCFPALWQTSPSPSCEIYAYGGGLLMASVNALHLLSNLYKWFFDLKMARVGYICRGEVNLCTKVELLRLAVLGLAPDTGQSMMAMVDVDVSSHRGLTATTTGRLTWCEDRRPLGIVLHWAGWTLAMP